MACTIIKYTLADPATGSVIGRVICCLPACFCVNNIPQIYNVIDGMCDMSFENHTYQPFLILRLLFLLKLYVYQFLIKLLYEICTKF